MIDSTIETKRHIKTVRNYGLDFITKLFNQLQLHDSSKLEDPEKEYFDIYTEKLKDCTYGSEEYKSFLTELKPALDHHYKHNSHHPEHSKNGLHDMNLLDLIEMFIDWKSATLRHADGDIYRSIALNKDRFNIDPQIISVFQNSVKDLKW